MPRIPGARRYTDAEKVEAFWWMVAIDGILLVILAVVALIDRWYERAKR